VRHEVKRSSLLPPAELERSGERAGTLQVRFRPGARYSVAVQAEGAGASYFTKKHPGFGRGACGSDLGVRHPIG
jgi:hypothetical protein